MIAKEAKRTLAAAINAKLNAIPAGLNKIQRNTATFKAVIDAVKLKMKSPFVAKKLVPRPAFDYLENEETMKRLFGLMKKQFDAVPVDASMRHKEISHIATHGMPGSGIFHPIMAI